MAIMGSRKHLKRFKAPKHWPIHPKENKWTTKPNAGPHAIEGSLPLLLIVRDILGVADNAREAKRIINNGEILVDGRARKDYKFPVGFMDVIEIPKSEKVYRVLPDEKGRLTLQSIAAENKDFKLCKITDKTTIRGGKTQLNLHDGRNQIVDNGYKVGDVVILKVPEQEITESIDFAKGNIGLITGGKHTGEIGRIKEINITKSSMPNTVEMETEDKNTFLTLKDYVFVIGKEKPAIALPGGK
ncbi:MULTISPECIES: 30S ribosomal protein S4e [Methanobacterium]|jgi:small subunit ribosomal protein S4e|uniref:Small ribosomal subunit protein eS4 n=1 Tax=Methanobacterium veterum TaxID=408577 RepID=A0A9E4ZW01_9EURY|nr:MULTISPECIES: 30S ribosomal protein S4e [Methanobacterium]MCZ3364658.1 30S ribosomal protein S4e [Methanobacterium veterum]MCZ3372412.1 30S ribosomal protein S4e [Methanobacterium veterum]